MMARAAARIRWLRVSERALHAVQDRRRRGILVPQSWYPNEVTHIRAGKLLRLESDPYNRAVRAVTVAVTGVGCTKSTDGLADIGEQMGITAPECSGVPHWSWADYAAATLRLAPKGERRDHGMWFIVTFDPVTPITLIPAPRRRIRAEKTGS